MKYWLALVLALQFALPSFAADAPLLADDPSALLAPLTPRCWPTTRWSSSA